MFRHNRWYSLGINLKPINSTYTEKLSKIWDDNKNNHNNSSNNNIDSGIAPQATLTEPEWEV